MVVAEACGLLAPGQRTAEAVEALLGAGGSASMLWKPSPMSAGNARLAGWAGRRLAQGSGSLSTTVPTLVSQAGSKKLGGRCCRKGSSAGGRTLTTKLEEFRSPDPVFPLRKLRIVTWPEGGMLKGETASGNPTR